MDIQNQTDVSIPNTNTSPPPPTIPEPVKIPEPTPPLNTKYVLTGLFMILILIGFSYFILRKTIKNPINSVKSPTIQLTKEVTTASPNPSPTKSLPSSTPKPTTTPIPTPTRTPTPILTLSPTPRIPNPP